MNNIETKDNVTKIIPLKSSFNISQKSIENCINIAKMNSINKKLFNNCCNSNCDIYNKSISKCVSNGSTNASIMLIDAFPSEYESFTGAFTDEKGYLLEECIKDTNIKRLDIYCTNIIKCFNIQDLNKSAIDNCISNFLYNEISLVKPKKIIFTHSAFNAGLKYNIIPQMNNVNYFSKIHTVINNIETDMYIVYDIKALNEQQREAFKEGMRFILQ